MSQACASAYTCLSQREREGGRDRERGFRECTSALNWLKLKIASDFCLSFIK